MRRLGSIVAAATMGLFAASAAGSVPPPEARPSPRATCPCPGPRHPGGPGMPAGCPFAAGKEAADVSVENTATGAVIRFQAKGGAPADIEKARDMARHVGQVLKEGPRGCPMMAPAEGQG